VPSENGTPRSRSTFSDWIPVVVGAAGMALLVAGVISAVRSQNARVAMFVTGAGHVVLTQMSVVVDGQERCSTRPCVVELDSGVHTVRTQAPGYSPQEVDIAITPGSSLSLHVTLLRDPSVDTSRAREP
jgi:hypothetical protein